MKQALSIDALINDIENQIHSQLMEGLLTNANLPAYWQALATAHVAKQTERVANNLDRLYVQSIEKHLAGSNVGKAVICEHRSQSSNAQGATCDGCGLFVPGAGWVDSK